MSLLSLSELALMQTARISAYKEGNSSYRGRLLALGLTPGTFVRVEKIAPFGDPVIIRVRGSMISLRKKEAEIIYLELC